VLFLIFYCLGECYYIEGLCVQCHCSECHGTLLGSASFGQKTLDRLAFSIIEELTLLFDKQFSDHLLLFNVSQQMSVSQMVFEQNMWSQMCVMRQSIIM